MGRKFAPFDITVHCSGKKTKKEMQKYIDEYYVQQIRDRLNNSDLSYEQKISVIDHLAALHEPKRQP